MIYCHDFRFSADHAIFSHALFRRRSYVYHVAKLARHVLGDVPHDALLAYPFVRFEAELACEVSQACLVCGCGEWRSFDLYRDLVTVVIGLEAELLLRDKLDCPDDAGRRRSFVEADAVALKVYWDVEPHAPLPASMMYSDRDLPDLRAARSIALLSFGRTHTLIFSLFFILITPVVAWLCNGCGAGPGPLCSRPLCRICCISFYTTNPTAIFRRRVLIYLLVAAAICLWLRMMPGAFRVRGGVQLRQGLCLAGFPPYAEVVLLFHCWCACTLYF